MPDKLQGPMCSTRCGPGWIDDGTLCVAQSSSPAITGTQARRHASAQSTSNRTFRTSIVGLGLGFAHGDPVPKKPMMASRGMIPLIEAGRTSFKALIWTTAKWTVLRVESQNFAASATRWERMFSPLVGQRLGHTGRPFFPVVDAHGTVVGYIARRIKPGHLHSNAQGRGTYVGRGVKPKPGCALMGGGDLADVLLDIHGDVLSIKTYDRANQPSMVFEVLSMAVGLAAGLVRGGLKSLLRRGLKRAAGAAGSRLGLLARLRLSIAGKFARGGGQRIQILHGISEEGRRAFASQTRKTLKFSGPADDFGRAVYLTRDPQVAQGIAKTRGGGSMLRAEIDTAELGRIVDVRPGGMHRKLWDDFMNQPVFKGGQSPGEIITSGRAGYRGQFFDDFLKKNGLQDADTILGPIGDAWTSGPALSFVSEQIAVRSEAVARRLAELLAKSL